MNARVSASNRFTAPLPLPGELARFGSDPRFPPPAHVADLVLPLAVAVFRMTSPAVNLAVCVFVAKVYGIEPSPLQYVGGVLVALAVSVGSVGLPGQVSFIVSVAPICIALGLPIDLLPILLAVEVAIFEAVHGTAPDIAGQGIANPGAVILAAAMMLDHLGKGDVARRVREAFTAQVREGPALTRDLGGAASTDEEGAK